MSIQKKSLLNSLNTTKKAIVASSTPAEEPKVSAKVSARFKAPMKAPTINNRLISRVRTRG